MIKKILKFISPVLISLCLIVGITKADQAYMLSFIPTSCCVSNECCWEITEKDVTGLPSGDYIINATGQRMSSTKGMEGNTVGALKISPDQKFYRCACDCQLEDNDCIWIKHDKANSRCLFIPNRGF